MSWRSLSSTPTAERRLAEVELGKVAVQASVKFALPLRPHGELVEPRGRVRISRHDLVLRQAQDEVYWGIQQAQDEVLLWDRILLAR